MRVRREVTGREEWRKGGGVAWIFKPKRQNVADKKRQREIRIGIGIERRGQDRA